MMQLALVQPCQALLHGPLTVCHLAPTLSRHFGGILVSVSYQCSLPLRNEHIAATKGRATPVLLEVPMARLKEAGASSATHQSGKFQKTFTMPSLTLGSSGEFVESLSMPVNRKDIGG